MNVSIRYIVDDVDAAAAFYRDHLGFDVEMAPGPGFAMLARGDLRLLLNTPGGGGGAGQTVGGVVPTPGGWNRFQITVDDLDQIVADMSVAGVDFRGEVVTGRGGRQVLADDPSGNPIELFEPTKR